MDISGLVGKDFVAVQRDATVSEMIGKLIAADQREALVFDKDKFLGLVVEKFITKSHLDASTAKLTGLVKNISPVDKSMDLLEAARLMFTSGIDILPVQEKGKIVGIVTVNDILTEAKSLPGFKGIKVRDIKQVDTPKLTSADMVGKAIELLHKEGLEALPVVEKEKLNGVICFHDILKKIMIEAPMREKGFRNKSSRAFEAERSAAMELKVDNFDTHTHCCTVTLGDSLATAIDLIKERDVHALVLINENDNKPLGLITTNNLLRMVSSFSNVVLENIRFTGLEETKLRPDEKAQVKEIIAQESEKIGRRLNNEYSIDVHIKEYKKESKKQKYDIHLKLLSPGKNFTSSGVDWDIVTALRMAMKGLEKSVLRQYQEDISRKKPYGR